MNRKEQESEIIEMTINLKGPHRILAIIMIGMLLSACALPSSAVAPGQSIDDIIAKTAAAAQTLTVTNLPSLPPTQTLTVTPTPSAPTITPSATFPFGIFVEAPFDAVVETPNEEIADVSSSSSDTNGVKIKYSDEPWSCVIIGKSPSNNYVARPGKNFYISWVVVNNGTKTWTRNGVDFVYENGLYQESGPIKDISKTILRGGKITLQILVIPPRKAGSYNVVWALKVGRGSFCRLKSSFQVE